MNADKIGDAHDSLIARIAGRQSGNKEEAEILALEAGALQSLAVAEKSRHELNDSISATARAQRWVQFVVGVAGIGGVTALGAWAVKFDKEKKELEADKARVAEQEGRHARLAEKHADLGNRIDLALNIDEVLKREIERKSELLKQKSLNIEDSVAQADTLRGKNENLKMEIVGLSPGLLNAIIGELPESSVLREVIVEAGKPVEVVPADPPEVNHFIPEVEKLFDANAGKRGQAYKDLTAGKDRTSQALLDALLEVGETKFQRLEKLPSEAKDELPLLKRGLENVLVTLRDISRTVTKLPEPNRNKVLDFANKLKLSSHGFEKEATSLIDWLKNGNYN